MNSDRLIWNAIVYVTEDRIQEAERTGQEKRVERLKGLLKLLEVKK